MNWIGRINKFWIGLAVGLVFPIAFYTMYWLLLHHQLSFPVRFTKFLLKGYMLSNVIKMCGLGNLILFYFGLTKKIDNFSKGIIVSVLVYVALVAYVSYYFEPNVI
jgi:hypothetical protein